MLRVIVSLIAASQLVFPAGPSFAQQRTPDMVVEAVLTRALAERAAFHACAPLQAEPDASVEFVVRTWNLDMGDTAKFLRETGYPDGYIQHLLTRLDLQKATPKFSSRAELKSYCAMLGDWFDRLSVYQYAIPQHELQRALKR
jgi:hypothetical protein